MRAEGLGPSELPSFDTVHAVHGMQTAFVITHAGPASRQACCAKHSTRRSDQTATCAVSVCASEAQMRRRARSHWGNSTTTTQAHTEAFTKRHTGPRSGCMCGHRVRLGGACVQKLGPAGTVPVSFTTQTPPRHMQSAWISMQAQPSRPDVMIGQPSHMPSGLTPNTTPATPTLQQTPVLHCSFPLQDCQYYCGSTHPWSNQHSLNVSALTRCESRWHAAYDPY